MTKLFKYILAAFIIVCAINVTAQEFIISTKIDTHHVRIGEQTHLKYNIVKRKDLPVKLPDELQSALSEDILVLNAAIDSGKHSKSEDYINIDLKITSFSIANNLVPALPFQIKHEWGWDTVWSKETYLQVYAVEVDTTMAARPLKPLEKPKRQLSDYAWFLIPYLAILIIALLVLYYERKRGKGRIKRYMNIEPAHVIALRDLDRLKAHKLWQQGQVKDYYTELTNIVRAYIERKFEIPAMEETSLEILNDIKKSDYNTKINYNSLRELLTLSDMVKFAKENPVPEENVRFLDEAFEFVKQTKEIGEATETEERTEIVEEDKS